MGCCGRLSVWEDRHFSYSSCGMDAVVIILYYASASLVSLAARWCSLEWGSEGTHKECPYGLLGRCGEGNYTVDVQFCSCGCPRTGRQMSGSRRPEWGDQGHPQGVPLRVIEQARGRILNSRMCNFTAVSVLARGDRNCMVAGENWGVPGHPQGVPLRIVEQVWRRKLHSGCAILLLWVSTYGETKIARSQARMGGVPGHPQGVPLRVIEQGAGKDIEQWMFNFTAVRVVARGDRS